MDALIFFSKAPIPGLAKTRLCPHYTAEKAALIYRAMLKDYCAILKTLNAEVFVFYYGGDISDFPDEYADFKSCHQEGEDIFERMENAFCKVRNKGYENIILIGGDIPEIDSRDLEEAFTKLKEKDFVIGKTADGGYYIIGGYIEKGMLPKDGKAETLINFLKNKGSVYKLKELSDIDYPEDLRNLYFTGKMHKNLKDIVNKFFKISIISPIFNEEKNIVKFQNSLYPIKDKAEIILVDGGSEDNTLKYIDSSFTLIESKKGRAAQMNTGAEKSSGDILFFLHSDSIVPENFLEEIRDVIKNHRAGCFGIRFETCDPLMKICQIISNHRIIDRKVMFGDQGIFIDRDLFFKIGKFPDLPIMEDYQFSLTLKERGERLGICRNRITTDYRRYPKSFIGKLKVMWKMNRLRKKYRDGIDISVIAKEYKDER